MALKENNKAYIRVIQEEHTRPSRPDFLDITEEAIRQLAIIKVGGNADLVTDLVIRELAKERQHENTRLRADWQKEMDKWDTCNTRACNLLFSTLDPIPASLVDKVENAREAYKILQAEYGTPSWQTNFKRFEILCTLQYKGNNPQDYVRRFKEALFEIYQRGSNLDANTTLNFFIRSIQNNPRCQIFIQALKPNIKDPNFMVEIYREFILTEGSSKIAIGYNSIPSVHTTSSNSSKDTNSSSSNFDKKRDAKKGNNKQSNNSNKDKSSKKKTDFVREDNVILCKHHGTLGNHYSNRCPLLKNSSNTITIQPTTQQVTVPQPGHIIGQVDNQGRIHSLQQQPRQGANAIYAPASYTSTPQQGPSPGDPLARYNTLFTNALFQSHAIHSTHIVSQEGQKANDNNDITRWMIDSGTSTHMTPHRSVFVNFRQCVLPVSTATGDVFYTEGYGDVILHLLNQDSTEQLFDSPLVLRKVWLAPELRSSLISMSALDKEDIGTWTKNGMMTFKHQDNHGPESTIGFATCKGEHYWLNCAGIDKINHMLDCNLVTGSPNSIFAINSTPISIDLAHRRACHAGEDRVRKMETFADGIKLKKGAGVTFPCAPCIKGKGHALPFVTEVYIQLETYLKTQFGYTVKRVHGDDATEHKPLATYLASKGTVWDPTPPYTKQLNGVAEIKNRHLVEPLVAVMTEYQLPKYLWGLLLGGINYTMNRLYASKIGMSPYEALFGPSTQAQDQGSSIITDRHIPVDFLNEYDYCTVPTQYYDNTGFGNKKQIQPRPSSPYRYRFSTPPPPTVEDDHEEHLDMPTNLPLDHIHPFILEQQAPVILPDPDTFVLPNDNEMAGSFGRFMEAQREDTGAHFEVGGRGTLVESQPASRQVVDMDIPTDMNLHQAPFQHEQLPSQLDQASFKYDFSHLNPMPDDRIQDRNYVSTQPIQPESGQLRRSTRIKKPSKAYIESLASKSFFDSNFLQLLADQPDILVSLVTNVTATEFATSKLTSNDVGFEPNGWAQAMSCVEKDKWLVAAHKELHRHLINA
ncbi:Retrovirus-related Pol polyprotein from transposon TNT 1-94 [Penicillium digitatum]|uniref:Retrovirus-related Pol polyprotein from transposon TNT 1-94 n=1 Tax=Penicillium digitatum TaxID=36651 RepID=A0A7T7BNE0_PENDI|nr:Retrovirus-related Pol polyprotein from transposon TNT 1-94 [Penicillium digitatum]